MIVSNVVLKRLPRILLTPVIGLLLLNAWLYLQQPRMLFYPYADLEVTPASWNLAYEDVDITTTDKLKLHGWFLPVKGAKHVVLFFHGNAGNISHRGESLEIFNRLGLNVLIVDYRGYGKSEGSASEQGFYRDAKAAWEYLIEKKGFQANDIIVFGRSLGGAVATQLASQVQPRGLIIESTFSSVKDMARIMMPLISRLVYLRYEFDTETLISKVKVPLLLMHSPDDDVIPYSLGVKIFEAANSPKYSYELSGSHNNGFVKSQPEYEQAIETFLNYIP